MVVRGEERGNETHEVRGEGEGRRRERDTRGERGEGRRRGGWLGGCEGEGRGGGVGREGGRGVGRNSRAGHVLLTLPVGPVGGSGRSRCIASALGPGVTSLPTLTLRVTCGRNSRGTVGPVGRQVTLHC